MANKEEIRIKVGHHEVLNTEEAALAWRSLQSFFRESLIYLRRSLTYSPAIIQTAEEMQVKPPSPPPDYVSLAVLRERWLKRKKQEEEAKKDVKCEEDRGDGEKSGGGVEDGGVGDSGKGKGVVVDEVRRGNVGRYRWEDRGYGYAVSNVGSRGFRDARVRGEVGVGERFGGREISGGREIRTGGDRRRFHGRRERFGVGVRREDEGVRVNVVGDRVYGDRRINEVEDVGGDRRRFGGRKKRFEVGVRGGDEGEREYLVDGKIVKGSKLHEICWWMNDVGGDCKRFGKGLGVEMGNVVEDSKDYEKRINEEMEAWGEFWEDIGKGLSGFREGFEVGKRDNEVEIGNVVGGKMLEDSKGIGNRRINVEEDAVGKFGGLEISGERKDRLKYGGDLRRFEKVLGVKKGENEVDKRIVVDFMEENVMDVKVLEGSKGLGNRHVSEEVEIGGKFKGSLRNVGMKDKVKSSWDRRWCGKVSGVGKGENVVEKRNVDLMSEESKVVKGNVVDVREKNVVDGKMLEVSKGYGFRRIDEDVDIGRKFGDLTINGGGRRGKFRSGGVGCRFQPRKEKIYVRVMKENEIEKPITVVVRIEDEVEEPIAVVVRGENEVEKPIPVVVRKENEVEKLIVVAVRGENEVEKQNLVNVRKEDEVEKAIGVVRGENEVEKQNLVNVNEDNDVNKQIPVAERDENEVEKQNLVDVKKENDVEKQIPVAVRDKNEVGKQNPVNVKMSETSKDFGHRRGNEAIGGKSEGVSDNDRRKGNVKHGRNRGRFGSWKNKQKESGMMWVRKCDAGADKQAQGETTDVK